MEQAAVLADFEAARGEWEAAFAKVPDEALGYLKAGDDYALGGLQVHVNWVLKHYSRVLEGILARGFERVDPQDRPGDAETAGRRAKTGLTAGERRKALSEMARRHSAVVSAVSRLPAEGWSRKAPVVYSQGQDPFPTSAEDIVGWLREHYREHVEQSAQLVSDWNEAGRPA